MKPVLLLVVDALSWEIVKPAMDEGRLPHFLELVEHGSVKPCTSIFPSITPAATASIITGHYPRQSGIAGAHWYDSEKDELAYFGDDFWVIAREGLSNFVKDFMVRLNQEHLKSRTLFELVEEQQLTSACVNFLWYKGTTHHQVDAPWLLKLLPGIDVNKELLGPHLLYLGDFVSTPLPGSDKLPKRRGGMSRRYGFHDESTIDTLLELVPLDNAPDVLVAYFPNNDFESHRRGPHEAAQTVERVDEYLGQLADRCGGMSALLEKYAVLIVGDHAQTELLEAEQERTIDLSKVLADYQLVEAGTSWDKGDELFVCPNMRSAQIYFRKNNSADQLAHITKVLLQEPAIDQLLWAQNGSDSHDYHVMTRDRGKLAFRIDNQNPMARDEFGNGWRWKGDLRAGDAEVGEQGTLKFGTYPNALERIVGGFSELSAPLWITAHDGAEFCLPATEIHEGGSHAALHWRDSETALLVGGLPPGVAVPDHPRIVDVVPLCLAILEVPADRAPGTGHYAESG